MSNWTSLANVVSDLRTFLHDGPLDRLVKQKIVLGAIDGVNTQYFTFEDRIIGTSLIVTVDFVPVTFTLDDNVTGEFHTTVAPPENSTVRGQYFYQYFLDSELQEALEMTEDQILQGNDVTTTPLGLKLSVLHYAGAFGYQKQAMRWAERISHKFLVEEEPLVAEALSRSNMFSKIADTLLKNGEHFRDDFYKGAGRQFKPSFGVYRPRIGTIGPRT